MIKQLIIQNFQSHKDTELNFHPGVNIIVGDTDSGKSGIMRAFRWLKDNRPTGEGFRSWWGGKMLVETFTDDAHIIHQKDKQDEYILGDTHFTAFKTEVPEEVRRALNFTDINIQRQLDGPFLLSKTSGEAALHFNRVAKLDKIDTGLTNVNSWIRELTNRIGQPAVKDKPATGLIKQIVDNERELTKYEHLDKFEAEIEVLEELDKQYKTLVINESKLELLIEEIEQVENEIENVSQILLIEKDLNVILDDMTKLEEIKHKEHSLSMAIQAIEWIDVSIEGKQKLLNMEADIDSLLQLHMEKDRLDKQYNDLSSLILKIENIEKEITNAKNTYEILHKEFEETFPDVCPLCDQKVKKHGKGKEDKTIERSNSNTNK